MLSDPQRPKSANGLGRTSTLLASYRADLNVSEPIPTSFKHNAFFPDGQPSPGHRPQHRQLDRSHIRRHRSAPRVRGGSQSGTTSEADNRLSIAPSVFMSSVSSVPSKSSLLQKKSDGGLKATLKRVFGSRRRRASVGEPNREFMLSDPGNLITSAPPELRRQITLEWPQLDRPVTQSSALGSHAPSLSFKERAAAGSMSSDASPTAQRHRNASFTMAQAGDKPRASSDSPGNVPQQSAASNSMVMEFDKKKSRSTDAIPEPNKNKGAGTDQQDRSAEIQRWKELAINPLPAPSARAADGGLGQPNKPKNTPTLQPAQSFDFGLKMGSDSDDLEDRVNTLEVKMYDFEFAIAKLQGIEISKPALPARLPKTKSAQNLIGEEDRVPRSASMSTQGRSFLESPSPSPHPRTDSEPEFGRDHEAPRASNATTIRRRPRRRKPLENVASDTVHLSYEQFETLKTMINDERAARQQMQMQILNLQKEVELLQAPVYATIRPLDYPGIRSEPRVTTVPQLQQKKLHRSPPFEFRKKPSTTESRFSVTDSDAGSETESTGSFATPQESHFRFNSPHRSTAVSVV